MDNYPDIDPSTHPLSRIVLQYSDLHEELVKRAKQPGFIIGAWAPPGELVADLHGPGHASVAPLLRVSASDISWMCEPARGRVVAHLFAASSAKTPGQDPRGGWRRPQASCFRPGSRVRTWR